MDSDEKSIWMEDFTRQWNVSWLRWRKHRHRSCGTLFPRSNSKIKRTFFSFFQKCDIFQIFTNAQVRTVSFLHFSYPCVQKIRPSGTNRKIRLSKNCFNNYYIYLGTANVYTSLILYNQRDPHRVYHGLRPEGKRAFNEISRSLPEPSAICPAMTDIPSVCQ